MELDEELAAVVAPLADGADLSVAVLDTDTGASAGYRHSEAYDTASIVKVAILAALLLRTQDEGRELNGSEHARAAAMIERSDNASATQLLRAVGGADGLDAANRRLGLTGTTAARAWGLTQTTATDQVRLLRSVFGTDPPLSEDSRGYLRELMTRVETDQQWGVSAAGDSWALKNGWMPRTTTGLWDINSIGQVRTGRRTRLMAVLSRGHVTRGAGISLVESVAGAAADVMGSRSGGVSGDR